MGFDRVFICLMNLLPHAENHVIMAICWLCVGDLIVVIFIHKFLIFALKIFFTFLHFYHKWSNISQGHIFLGLEISFGTGFVQRDWDVLRSRGRNTSVVVWKISTSNMRVLELSLYRCHYGRALLLLNRVLSLKVNAHFGCFFLWFALIEFVGHRIFLRVRSSVGMGIIWAIIPSDIDVVWILDWNVLCILWIFDHSTRFQNFLCVLNLQITIGANVLFFSAFVLLVQSMLASKMVLLIDSAIPLTSGWHLALDLLLGACFSQQTSILILSECPDLLLALL